jgi:hypothetical protein
MDVVLLELENAPGQDSTKLLDCRLAFTDGTGLSDEAQDLADLLTDRIEPSLPKIANAEIIGFEPSPHHIDMLTFGWGE